LIEAVKAHAPLPRLKVDPMAKFLGGMPEKIEQDWFWNVSISRLRSSHS
jgi:hypothetical protein